MKHKQAHLNFTTSKTGFVVLALTMLSASAGVTVLHQSIMARPMQQDIQHTIYQLSQVFAGWEQRLSQSSLQDQQTLISSWQQGTFNRLVQEDPQARLFETKLLLQSMSPRLAQLVLFPVVSQLSLQEKSPNQGGSNALTLQPGQHVSSDVVREADTDHNGDGKTCLDQQQQVDRANQLLGGIGMAPVGSGSLEQDLKACVNAELRHSQSGSNSIGLFPPSSPPEVRFPHPDPCDFATFDPEGYTSCRQTHPNG